MSDAHRYSLRPSPELRAVVATAQGPGECADALRALLYLGAVAAGLEVSAAQREIARLALEDLDERVVQALHQLAQPWQPSGSHPAARLPAPLEDADAPLDEADPFAVGFDV